MRRKSTGKFLCVLLVFVLAFVTVGCGAEGETSDRARAQTEEEERLAKEERETAQKAERAADQAQAEQKIYYFYNSMEEYVASDLVRNILNSTLEEYNTDEIGFSIKGEGNRLIYEYTYKTLTMTEEMTPLLEEELEKQADALQSVADSLKDVVNVEQPTVVVRYLDMNGAQIAAREYTAQ